MSKEQEGSQVTLSAIKLDLKEKAVIFEAGDKPVAKLTFAQQGMIFEALPDAIPAASLSPAPTEQEAEDKQLRVTLTGRLQAKPLQGKPDRSNNPTAYARFAAHVDGQEGPHVYVATFHRHTAQIALRLGKDAQITVDGYPHPSESDSRLDTFSVINILDYPGKPLTKK